MCLLNEDEVEGCGEEVQVGEFVGAGIVILGEGAIDCVLGCNEAKGIRYRRVKRCKRKTRKLIGKSKSSRVGRMTFLVTREEL